MTDCNNIEPQNDSEEDIYKDISEINLEKEVDTSTEVCKKEEDLSEKMKVLKEENKKLKDLNRILEKNLSILLKTAQTEVKRKDSVIEELRVQINSFTLSQKKFTKDKYTSTDYSESVIDLKNSKDCQCGRESQKTLKNERSKSRCNSDNDYKSLKTEEVHFNEKSYKQRSADCDIKKKKKYKDVANEASRHLDDHEGDNLKYRVRSRSSYRGSKASYDPYRQDCRDRTKYFPEDLNYRKRYSNKLDNNRYSSRERDTKEGSAERKKEKKNRKIRSQSRERSKSNKESSLEKHRKIRLSVEEDSKNWGKDHVSKKRRHSEKTKNAEKREENSTHFYKSKEQNKPKVNENFHEKHWSNDKNTIPNFERKSPLNALYEEEQLPENTNYFSKSYPDSIQEQCKLEKDVFKDDDLSSSANIQNDWTLSFKNERKNDIKSMTLYSKRMMQKFSTESKVQENRNIKNNVISQTENLKNSVLEKEPGELTDDENEVEKSEEFQEVAKAAVFESKAINKKPIAEQEKFIKGNLNEKCFENENVAEKPDEIKNKSFSESPAKTSIISESESIPNQEQVIYEKKIDCSKEVREVIEFSPFKNNYKLIEISPIRAGIRLKEGHTNKLIVNSTTQKQVEASVFNLLSSLSGVPLEFNSHESSLEKFELDNNKSLVPTTEIIKASDKPDEVQCESVDNMQGGKSTEPQNLSGDKKSICQLPNINNDKNSEKNNHLLKKEIDKNHAEEEEKKINVFKGVKNVENSPEVSGAPQLIDFFMLTSSPSKPVSTEEQEKSIINVQKKNIFVSSNSKSDENVIIGVQTKLKKSRSKVTKTSNCNGTKSKKRKDSCTRDSQTKALEKINDKMEENLTEAQMNEKLIKLKDNKSKETNCKLDENNLGGVKRKAINNENEEAKEEKNKRKRKLSECGGEMPTEKKNKLDKYDRSKKKTMDLIKVQEDEEQKGEQEKVKEDISFFEFFKPITKKEETEKIGREEIQSTTDFKMTRTMSLTGVLHLETPTKCVEKLKNVMINEQTIYQVLDSKNNSSFSPLIGAKLVEMTPRRLLKNDLMLTDSEDDSVLRLNQEDAGLEQDDGNNVEMSESENSECESDSGASAFVDLL